MEERVREVEDELSFFNLSAAAYPFTPALCQQISARRWQLSSQLFFDCILPYAASESISEDDCAELYPPETIEDFYALFDHYTRVGSGGDGLRKDCVTYYLLKFWDNGGGVSENGSPETSSRNGTRTGTGTGTGTALDSPSVRWMKRAVIPPHYVVLTDAYFYLDRGDLEKAIPLLCSPRLTPANTSKILHALSLQTDISTYSLTLRYIRSVNPPLTEPWEMELYAKSLLHTGALGLANAMRFMQELKEDSKEREGVWKAIVEGCVLPKPSPHLLKSLLFHPLSQSDHDILLSLISSPSHNLRTAPKGLAILKDLIITRLIVGGELNDAARLEREWEKDNMGRDASEASARRKALIGEAMGGRIRNDMEMEEEEKDTGKRGGVGIGTPRQSRPLIPKLHASSSTPLQSTSSSGASTPVRPRVSLPSTTLATPRPRPSITIDPPPIQNSTATATATPKQRFGTPPRLPLSTPDYIRSQGAPSPASPANLSLSRIPGSPGGSPGTLNGKGAGTPRMRSVQKTRNAFYTPENDQNTGIWGDSTSTPTPSLFGGPLRSSGLREVITHTPQAASDAEEDGEDERDDFVVGGARLNLPPLPISAPPSQPEPEVEPEPAVEENLVLRPSNLQEDKPRGRRGIKRTASRQLQNDMDRGPPGAFPRSEIEEPVVQTRRMTRSVSKSRELSASVGEEVPPVPSIPGAFRDEEQKEAEERDSVTSLPSLPSQGRKRNLRAASVESDVSTSEGGAVRRSSRLSAAGSDTESAAGAGAGRRKKKAVNEGSESGKPKAKRKTASRGGSKA